MNRKIKVVWICEFSNSIVRSHLSFRNDYLDSFVRKLFHKQSMKNTDYGIWNTNGIEEIKKYSEIELFVVSPHYHIKGNEQRFDQEGIHYLFFNDEKNSLVFHFTSMVQKNKRKEFKHNRKIIKKYIEEIKPDIVHVIGAENPHYSLSALDVSSNLPVIVQLQTLVCDPEFIKKYPKYSKFNIDCEKKVLLRANYIGTTIKKYRSIINEMINPNANFLGLKLAVGSNVRPINVHKEYDFIYFSVNINKAFDLAIEAFALAHQEHPEITLCVVGYYSPEFKDGVDKRIKELGVEKSVFFQGHQPTHDDVLTWVAKCRFALLPLKFDNVSTTIREAMSLGVPVITTITSGTPSLNEKRQSVLLSKINDHAALADNMKKLLLDDELAKTISENAIETVKEQYDNSKFMKEWVITYCNLVRNESK